MDIKDFDKLWTQYSEDVSVTQNFWDLRAEEFNKNAIRKEGNESHADVIDFLTSKGMLNKDMEVLDIGCGPGRYSLKFSKVAKRVTGIDISPKMIQFAKENYKNNEVKNVDFMLVPWGQIDLNKQEWIKKYDLVFASMCPGINNSETLMKMVQASKGFCFLSSFANRTDKIKDELNREILGQSANPRGKNKIYYAFNILWQSGLYPEICYQDVNWENVWTLEKAINIFSLQLGKGINNNIEIKKKVENYLTRIAKNGIIKETTNAKIAWMYWKTNS